MVLRLFHRKVRRHAKRHSKCEMISKGDKEVVSKKIRSSGASHYETNRSPTRDKKIDDTTPPALNHRDGQEEQNDEIVQKRKAEDFPFTLVDNRTLSTIKEGENENENEKMRSSEISRSSYDGDESAGSVGKPDKDDISLKAITRRVIQFYSTEIRHVFYPHHSIDVSECHHHSREKYTQEDNLEQPWDNVQRSYDDSLVHPDVQNDIGTTNEKHLLDGVGDTWCGMMLLASSSSAFLEQHISLSSSAGSDDDEDDVDEDEADGEESIITNKEEHQNKGVFLQHHRAGSEAFKFISKDDISVLRKSLQNDQQSHRLKNCGAVSPLLMKQLMQYDIPNVSGKNCFLPIIKTTTTEDETTANRNDLAPDNTQRFMRCCHPQLCVVPEGFKSCDVAFHADHQPQQEEKPIQSCEIRNGCDRGLVDTSLEKVCKIHAPDQRAKTETLEEEVIPKPMPMMGSSHDHSERMPANTDQDSVKFQWKMPFLTINTTSNGCAFTPHASPRTSEGGESSCVSHKDEDGQTQGYLPMQCSQNGGSENVITQRRRTIGDQVNDQPSCDDESALDFNYTTDDAEDCDDLSEASDVLSTASGFVAHDSEEENVPVFCQAKMPNLSSPRWNKGILAPSFGHSERSMANTFVVEEIFGTKPLIVNAEGIVMPNDPNIAVQFTSDLGDRDLASPCIHERPQWMKASGDISMDEDHLQDVKESLHDEEMYHQEDLGLGDDWEPEPCVSDDDSLMDYGHFERELDYFLANNTTAIVPVARRY